MDLTRYSDAGRELVSAITEQMRSDGLRPDAREEALLDTAARLADRMAVLSRLVGEDGERNVSESGIVRLHPAIAEHRQHSVALAKVLASVSMADTTKDPKKQRAADSRWRQHNTAKAG